MNKRIFLRYGMVFFIASAPLGHALASASASQKKHPRKAGTKAASASTNNTTSNTTHHPVAKGVAVRIWPSEDYTRVTLENATALSARHFMLHQPERLVVDLDQMVLGDNLKNMVAQISAQDPFIEKVRVAQFQPQVVRVVFDLKQTIRPQVFTLKPVSDYAHRLVFDLYSEKSTMATRVESNPTDPAAQNAQANADTPTDSNSTEPAVAQTDSRSPTKTSAKKKIIMLDPGHGGEDPGAIGPSGTREKDVVLNIAKQLKQKLEQMPGQNFTVLLTRESDYFVPLHIRVQKARQAQADCFISIHADAFIEPRARGASVFALSEGGASSTAAKWLAKKENSADLVGGVNLKARSKELANLLLDLTTGAQIQSSLVLGNNMLRQLRDFTPVHSNRVEQAGFAVLKAPDIPSILVETGFISNPEEEKLLTSPAHQEKLVSAFSASLTDYMSKHAS